MKNIFFPALLNITMFFILVFSCAKKIEEPIPDTAVFSPTISLSANLSSSDPLTDYTAEYQAIYAMGARGAQTVAPWSTLNPTGTTYDLAQINDANIYFGLTALKNYGFTDILLTIPIVAITARKLPADLAANYFNDAAVKSRLHLLINQVVPFLNANVKYISLGNEVDSYFATHGPEVAAFKELIEDARTYIKTLKPDILVGVTTTFDGATGSQVANVASLNENMDVIIMTYYPVNPGFFARDPSVVATDMLTMVTTAGSKKLVLQEWGYPSSTVNLGSAAKQSEFITNTIAAWRTHGTSRIPFISFFKRRDWNAAHCGTVTGQVAGQAFYEFMCSLGLYTNAATAKTAYQSLLNEVAGF